MQYDINEARESESEMNGLYLSTTNIKKVHGARLMANPINK